MLQHDATRCNTVQHAAIRCNTLQHAATRCNTMQHAATRCCHCTARENNPPLVAATVMATLLLQQHHVGAVAETTFDMTHPYVRHDQSTRMAVETAVLLQQRVA